MILPPHSTEIFQCSGMTCGVTMVRNCRRGLEMFSKPLSKCPCWLSYILLITFHPFTLVPTYYATLFGYVVFVFRCHQDVFEGLPSSKVNLYAMLLEYIFEAFTKAFYVWYCYVISSNIGLVVCYILLLVFVAFLCNWPWLLQSIPIKALLWNLELG